MKLLKITKSVISKIIAKKQRRRTRIKKTTNTRFGRNYQNPAERLIANNYNLTFSNPTPERAGEKRARLRLIEHRKQWAGTPDKSRMTRQRLRSKNRRTA